MEVARQEAGRFADGVHLVELAAVLDPALVPAAVVTALGAQQVPGVPVTGLLAGILERQQLLLVMDNCEMFWGPSRSSWPECCPSPMTSGSWRPAGSRSG